MIRFVKPDPAALVSVATILAPKISSFGDVVVAAPLLDVVLLPVAAAVTSSTLTPRYSRMRTSGMPAAVSTHHARAEPARFQSWYTTTGTP